MRFTSDAGDQAFKAAVAAIESASAVEVVVAVRQHARRWMVQHVVVGLIAGMAVLVYAVLFQLAPWAVLALPPATGIASALIVEWVAPLYRFLVPEQLRKLQVRDVARALFVDRTVHGTRDRTGILVFIAVRARVCEIVGDVGVLDKLGQATLDDYAAKLGKAIARGAEATANVLTSFVPELAVRLPRRLDDRNELPDSPVAVPPAAH
jgi:putative membrane protein